MNTDQACLEDLLNQPAYTPERMSEAIYDCLCEGQVRESAYGEDNDDNSVAIEWSPGHQEWQIIWRWNTGECRVEYDHFYEGSFEDWDPLLLLSLCDDLDLIDSLQESWDDQQGDQS